MAPRPRSAGARVPTSLAHAPRWSRVSATGRASTRKHKCQLRLDDCAWRRRTHDATGERRKWSNASLPPVLRHLTQVPGGWGSTDTGRQAQRSFQDIAVETAGGPAYCHTWKRSEPRSSGVACMSQRSASGKMGVLSIDTRDLRGACCIDCSDRAATYVFLDFDNFGSPASVIHQPAIDILELELKVICRAVTSFPLT